MLLCDKDIRAHIEAGHIDVSPYSPASVQPASIDVRLGAQFLGVSRSAPAFIDPLRDQQLTELTEVPAGEPFTLYPGEFVLGSTEETFTLPCDIAGRLEGKSSLGRLGLLVHSTAGFIDPGFTGTVTLELSNATSLPIRLWPGMKIGQLCLLRLTSPAEFPYGDPRNGSKYQGQTGPTASRSHLDSV